MIGLNINLKNNSMKPTLTTLLLLLSIFVFSQEQKHYRVVEYFKTENRYIYFHWTTDSAATYKVANTRTDKGAIYTVEVMIMTPKKAEKENKKEDRRRERERRQMAIFKYHF